jgi:hypothetical protein
MELEIIRHEDILFRDLIRVVNIKNAAWPHPIESQLKWILENQSIDDFHVILIDKGEDLAYMDLCPVKAEVDGVMTDFLGIGNVCTKTRGIGHGGILVKKVNAYLDETQAKGLLFCKDKVMRFYEHYGWQVIPTYKVTIDDEGHDDVYVIEYNMPSFRKLRYSDRLF